MSKDTSLLISQLWIMVGYIVEDIFLKISALIIGLIWFTSYIIHVHYELKRPKGDEEW